MTLNRRFSRLQSGRGLRTGVFTLLSGCYSAIFFFLSVGACNLCSYKQYFDGTIFRPENYRGHLFSRASDLLLILIFLHYHRCKELYVYNIVIFSSLLSNTVLFYSIEKIMRRDRGCLTDTLQNKIDIQ